MISITRTFLHFLITAAIILMPSAQVLASSSDDDMPCLAQRQDAYNCLKSTPDIAPAQIPNCLSCLTREMGEDGLIFTTSCEEAQESTFCRDVAQCVVQHCEESCLWSVANAYDCVLEDAKLETGCYVCRFAEDFMLAVV